MRSGAAGNEVVDILRRAAQLNEAQRQLHIAFERRDSGPGMREAWKKSAKALHKACADMYPDDFWRLVSDSEDGNEEVIDALLVFLEADPWCFRSGYAKEAMARPLRRHQLTPPQRNRLESVLLHLVDVGDRREFSEFCKLARRNATPELRAELKLRLASNDEGVRRRALVMLTSMRHARLDAAEVAVARDIILHGARLADPEHGLPGAWVGRLAERFGDDHWAARLAEMATEGGADSAAALRILGLMCGVRLSDEHREAMAGRVLSAIDTGDDETWFEGLVPFAESAEFRQALTARAESADPSVVRRVYWARNHLKHENGERAPHA